MKIVANNDRNGAEHSVEGRDGWSVMEILRDAGLPHRGRMRPRLAPAPLPRLCL